MIERALATADAAEIEAQRREAAVHEGAQPKKLSITDEGAVFKSPLDGNETFIGPRESIAIQEALGADIMFAFDECTPSNATREYIVQSLSRTHRWAKECLSAKKTEQALFGIVQGSHFQDLREESTRFIGALPFDGFGIGGDLGDIKDEKRTMFQILDWTIPSLPEEKPRHLLGVGKVEDIFEAIENGIDTFDCVIPTREARHGRLYTKTGHLDIRRGYFSKDKPGSRFFDSAFSDKAKPLKNSLPGKKIEPGCKCPTWSAGIPRWKIRELIKSKDRILNAQGQRWCLIHNMWFFHK